MRATAAGGRRLLLMLPLLLLVCLTSACGEKQVAKVQTEGEAIEIVDRLREHGLEADKEEVGEGEAAAWRVIINEGWFGGGETSHAMQILHYYKLPRPPVNVKKDDTIFPSPGVEHAQYLREREAAMENSLRMWPGVARVSVAIVLPQEDTIKLDPYPATASVNIITKEPKAAFTLEQVQSNIAGGVPGLKPEKVSVTLAYEPPPVVPQQDLRVRRRNNILMAAGLGLLTVLCFLVGVLLLQTRRQRAELVALREYEEPAEETEAEPEATAAPALGDGQRARLADTGRGAGARQLPGASSSKSVEDTATVK